MNQKSTVLSQKQMATLLAMLMALMPLSIDAYLPAIPNMAESLGADIHRIEQSLSTFLLGVAAGQLVGGSLSDIKGRRVIALSGLVVFIIATFGLAAVQTGEQLLMLRMVQAFGAGMTVVVVGAVVRDQYEGREAAQMFALIGIILMIAPLIAPLAGAGLQALGGWRLIFVSLAVYAMVVWGLLLRFVSKPIKIEPLSAGFMRGVLMRYLRVFKTRIALGFLFFQAFSFSSMFVFLTESSFVYMELYGVSAHAYAWIFGLNIITMAVFNRITAWHLKTGSNAENILLWGILIQLVANVILVTSVLIAGLPPLWWLVMWIMISVGTQGLITANTQACYMTYFREESGSANAVLGVCQSLIAASVGFLATWLHNGTAWVMTGMMLCATLSGMALLWWFSRQVWHKQPVL